MDWDRKGFGRWLRTRRVTRLPTLSQRELAEKVGVTQAKWSRWEQEIEGTSPPDLIELANLARVFDEDATTLLQLCGWGSDEGRAALRTMLVSLLKHELDEHLATAATLNEDMGGYLSRLFGTAA